jgi:hypothetical protein
MKFSKATAIPILVTLLLAFSLAAAGQTLRSRRPTSRGVRVPDKRTVKDLKETSEAADAEASGEQPVERTIAANPSVAVKVCVASGSITVHGWDRKEVRARSTDVAEIEFQHEGEPASKIQLLIADRAQGPGRTTSCLSFSDVDLDVPRGAAVQLQTRDGDINVADVATAYVNTQNGDVSIERASKAVDAGTVGGVIYLKDSSGSVNLHSVGGNIEASGVRPGEASDTFDASSVGGDIMLEQVAHARLNARSLNGSLNMIGPLAHEGHYGFKTISGDVTLTLPVNASFKLSAKLSRTAEIITDFPITLMSYATAPVSVSPMPNAVPAPAAAPQAPSRYSVTPVPRPEPGTPPPPPAEAGPPSITPDSPENPQKGVAKKGPKAPHVLVEGYPLRRLDGVCGSGDAFIDIGSFSGTVHLKKQ